MDDIQMEPPAWLLETIARSDADLAAGRLVSGEEVLAELFAALEELEARDMADRHMPPAA
jgi:predicted transcriptional regulator